MLEIINLAQKMISSSMINDNFCDCEDGTDETSKLYFLNLGTNACENGKFICKNLFHIEKIIPTSRVFCNYKSFS